MSFYVLLAVGSGVLVTIAATTDHISVFGDASAVTIVTWMALCSVANVLPVPSTPNVYLSMSMPVNIAIAALFTPGFAAVIVAASSVSEWEIKGETTVPHAAFNRVQLGLSTAAAALAFAAIEGDRSTITDAVLAVIAYHGVNWTLVALAERTARRVPLRRAVRGLLPPGVVASISYIALGLMGVALAETYREVGAWAVAVVLAPLLGARLAVATSGKLAQAQRAQRMLANRLIDERERERARIAAKIHDVVLQDLAGLKLVSANVRVAVRADGIDTAERLAGELETRVADAIHSLRDAIADLRRTTLDDAGIGATLSKFVRAFTAQTGIDVELSVSGVVGLPPAVSLLLYECCQEALQNVARHADARNVQINLERTGATVELTVTDDGIGIGIGKRHTGGVGLLLVRDKVELSGGALVAQRLREGGTAFVVTIPLADGDVVEAIDT